MYVETHLTPMLLLSGEVRAVALELVTACGTRVPVLVSATAVRDDRGRIGRPVTATRSAGTRSGPRAVNAADPATILATLNDVLRQDDATNVVVHGGDRVADGRPGALAGPRRPAYGGHPLGLLVRADGEVVEAGRPVSCSGRSRRRSSPPGGSPSSPAMPSSLTPTG